MKTRWLDAMVMLLAIVPSGFAAGPATTMLVPSGDNSSELMKLSHRDDVMADIFTVDRKVRHMVLDGAGADALSGRDLDAPTGSGAVIRIPFDQVALVYYRGGGKPSQDVFPSLAAVGPIEQAMGCDSLLVESQRAETVRWWARVTGAMPFTAHEISQQRTHTAEMVAGAVVAWPLLLYGAVAGVAQLAVDPVMNPGGKPLPHFVSVNAYRWAVTAADRRELGLLRLKRDHVCAARTVGKGSGTDLTILADIDDSVRALAAKQLAEDEQMARQTRWLDQFYPLPPIPVVAPLSDRIDFKVEWRSNVDTVHHPMKALNRFPLVGYMQIHEDGLRFSGKPVFGKHKDTEIQVPYSELSNAEVVQIVDWQGVVITYRDGHQDLLAIFSGDFNNNVDLVRLVRDQVESRLATGP